MAISANGLRVLRVLEDESHRNTFELASSSGLSFTDATNAVSELTGVRVISGVPGTDGRYAINAAELRKVAAT